jgi:hypothetical protein
VRLLLGRAPAQGENLSSIERTYEDLSSAVAGRDEFSPHEAVVSNHEFDLEGFRQNPLLTTHFAGLSWSIKVVDLNKVLAFQKAIKVDGLDERLKPVLDDSTLLGEFCVPSEQPIPSQGVIADVDQRGFTVSSLNPNLRIAGTQIQGAQVAPEETMQPIPMLAITFLVSMGTSYLQVVRYNGRCFLRDGYHRAAGLLRAGITLVPCVYIEARSFEEVGAAPATMFSYEILFGLRPPSLTDFWDDSVTRDVQGPSIRRVVRLRGEEFSVQG